MLGKLIAGQETKAPAKGVTLQQVSDVRIYALQHLEKVNQFVQKALAEEPTSSINHFHYQQLQQEIEKIKDPNKK